jgi:YfiH family protein
LSSSQLPADWPAAANVHAFTTLRTGPGVSEKPFDRFNLGLKCGDDIGLARENRRRLRAGLPSEPVWLQQVHGVRVLVADGASKGGPDEPIADASVTRTPGVVLAVLTADCLPALFCNREGTEVGAAHAGWRGLAAGVLEATVAAMASKPEDLMVWLGPAAGPEAYEIGEDVFEAFVEHEAAAIDAFKPTRPGHWRVDLYALARRRLAAMGVNDVYGGELCSISDPMRFYSHRRDGRSGRMASLIWC